MLQDKIGVTIETDKRKATLGVYESPDGVPVFEAVQPYAMADGKSLESPVPVIVVNGTTYIDATGNAQSALAVTGLKPPSPGGPTWDAGTRWDANTFWS